MIGSVFEGREQLADLERRRQVAQQRQAAVPSAASPVAAPSAGALAGAGGGTTGMAFKGAEPDVAKRKKQREERIGRDLRDEVPPAAERDMAGEPCGPDTTDDDASKAYQDRGVALGPGEHMAPGRPGPEGFRRPDLARIRDGRAAPSPHAQPARVNPMPAMVHYVPPGRPADGRGTRPRHGRLLHGLAFRPLTP